MRKKFYLIGSIVILGFIASACSSSSPSSNASSDPCSFTPQHRSTYKPAQQQSTHPAPGTPIGRSHYRR